MTWVPHSQRTGSADPDGPFDGVPSHLKGYLAEWAADVAGEIDRRQLESILLRLRVSNSTGSVSDHNVKLAVDFAFTNEHRALDLVDALLYHGAAVEWEFGDGWPAALRRLLSDGGSVWTVSSDDRCLVHMVDQRLERIYDQAVSGADEATEHLRDAWSRAYGRAPDASLAWHFAIKALEATLIPVVIPKIADPTLGKVVGALRGRREQPGELVEAAHWKMPLPNVHGTYGVGPFVQMLNLIWPNHDRHPNGMAPSFVPTLAQARMVVTLTATIIQWQREGWIVAKR